MEYGGQRAAYVDVVLANDCVRIFHFEVYIQLAIQSEWVAIFLVLLAMPESSYSVQMSAFNDPII